MGRLRSKNFSLAADSCPQAVHLSTDESSPPNALSMMVCWSWGSLQLPASEASSSPTEPEPPLPSRAVSSLMLGRVCTHRRCRELSTADRALRSTRSADAAAISLAVLAASPLMSISRVEDTGMDCDRLNRERLALRDSSAMSSYPRTSRLAPLPESALPPSSSNTGSEGGSRDPPPPSPSPSSSSSANTGSKGGSRDLPPALSSPRSACTC
mmetsp:Transcript_26071/g.62017  ORF Transcript_26071/g.62017 Transcript_26071/m.62017 type:complete len:212 (-) Transcript_26071:731-1366(-)